MAMNRIRFQHGMSLHFQRYGTETQCVAALARLRWPDGFRCPSCGGAAHCVLRGGTRKTFQYNACHHQTSLIAGTLFEATKLGLTVWFLAIYLIGEAKTGLSTLALKRDLGVSYPEAKPDRRVSPTSSPPPRPSPCVSRSPCWSASASRPTGATCRISL